MLLVVAASLAATGAGLASSASSASAVVSPAIAESYPDELRKPVDQGYSTGSFFYGNDCGGNSPLTAAPAHTGLPSGVILSGAAGREIVRRLNCGDRRSALGSYRDAFQGKIGQPYSWRNQFGGATGSITALRRYQEGGALCTYFHALVTVSQSNANSTGTACRLQDGNWHTQ